MYGVCFSLQIISNAHGSTLNKNQDHELVETVPADAWAKHKFELEPSQPESLLDKSFQSVLTFKVEKERQRDLEETNKKSYYTSCITKDCSASVSSRLPDFNTSCSLGTPLTRPLRLLPKRHPSPRIQRFTVLASIVMSSRYPCLLAALVV